MTLSLCLWMSLLFQSEPARRPNVIVILADDLGYETIGANGGTSYKTPVLDRLAASGARFEHCYAQPLCTPTRVQIMTGALNVRNYTTFGHFDPKLRTFAHLFTEAGYKTGIAGKWQLGPEVDLPKRLGFDEYCLWHHTRRPPRYANPGLEYNGIEKNFTNGEYGPDLIEQFAEDFISRHADSPFFLYYPMTLTHAPNQPTPDSADWNPKGIGEKVNQHPKHFADMVTYMDKLMGRLLAKLDETGNRENTLIIFLGDNGTGRGIRSKMNEQEVIGGKGTTTSRGMHVPLIVDWPARIKKGAVVDHLVDTTDVLPTICQAAGIGIPKSMVIDGRSFLPQVLGEAGSPREWLFSWYSPHEEPPVEFAFNARYKLYKDGRFFDLTTDIEERMPIVVDTLDRDRAKVAAMLKEAIDRYRDARPAELGRGMENRPRNKKHVPKKVLRSAEPVKL
jgi:arylsulfatase A